MARITKAPEERRDELLDVAMQLCVDVGYESLSIDQITREAGVAKGTFYYHFSTKQDMVRALADRFADELFANLEALAATLTGTGEERLRTLLLSATAWKTSRLEDALAFIPLLYKPENLELRHLLFNAWTLQTHTLFAPLIAQGARDGSFDVAPSEADTVTDIVLSLWTDCTTRLYDRALAHDNADGFAAVMVPGIRALQTAVERVLGATPGSMQVELDDATIHKVFVPFKTALGHPVQ